MGGKLEAIVHRSQEEDQTSISSRAESYMAGGECIETKKVCQANSCKMESQGQHYIEETGLVKQAGAGLKTRVGNTHSNQSSRCKIENKEV